MQVKATLNLVFERTIPINSTFKLIIKKEELSLQSHTNAGLT